MSPVGISGVHELVVRADTAWRDGDLPAARRFYAGAAAGCLALAGEPMPPPDAVARLFEQVGTFALLFGDTDAAEQLLRFALTAAERAGEAERRDSVLLRLLHIAVSAGDANRALAAVRALERSTGRLERVELSAPGLLRFECELLWAPPTLPRLLPRLYLELGRFLCLRGLHRSAGVLFARGTSHCSAGSEDDRTALVLASAEALLTLGDAGAAADTLTPLAVDGRRYPGLAVNRDEALGRAAFLAGDLGQALRCFAAAADAAERAQLGRARLLALANCAELELAINLTAAAEARIAGIMASPAVTADPGLMDRLARLVARAARASSPAAVGARPVIRLQDGAPRVDRPPAATEIEVTNLETHDYLARFEARAAAVRARLGTKDAAAALAELQQDFEDAESELIQARLLMLTVLVGVYSPARSRRDPAALGRRIEQTESALGIFSRLRARLDEYETARVLAYLHRHTRGDGAEAGQAVARAKGALDLMAGSLPVVERAQFLLDKWTQREDTLAAAINAISEQQAGTRNGVLRYWRRLRFFSQLVADVYGTRRELQQRLDLAEVAAPPRRSPFLQRLALRSPSHRVLGFLVLPDAVVVFTIGWMRVDFRVAAVTRTQLRGLVRAWHRAVSGLASRDLDELGDEISRALMLDELLGGTADPAKPALLTVVPDDCLHGLPFAALRVRGKRLVESFALHVEYDPLPARRRPRTRRPGTAALFLGTAAAHGDHAALPRTAEQADVMQQWARRRDLEPVVLLDRGATLDSLCEGLQRARHLHVCCHGLFSPEDPRATGFLVPGPNGEGSTVISIRDLALLPLGVIAHATLMSCWAADNYVIPGRWIVSLPEVFRWQGAGSVLAGLWEVEASHALRLVRSFYQALDQRLSRAAALRRCQLEMLRDPQSADPVWWSGFQLYGEPGRLAA